MDNWTTELDKTIDDTEDSSASTVKLTDEREFELSRSIDDTEEESLSTVKLVDERQPELDASLEDTEEGSESTIMLTDERTFELDKNLEDSEEHSESTISLENKNPNGEIEELHDSLIAQVENLHGSPEELYNYVIEMASDYSKWASLEEKDYQTFRSLLSKLSDDDLYNVAITMASAGEKGSGTASGWFSKVSAQMSAYLSSAEVDTTERLKGYIEAASNNASMALAGSQAVELQGTESNLPLGSKKVDMMYNTSDRKGDSIWAKAAEAT